MRKKLCIYFSDFFNVDEVEILQYGAFNISLINDLPLFVDPFLIFNSEKPEYKKLHADIIEYIKFLRNKSSSKGLDAGLLKSWYLFPEVKQNWFGYSESGNNGRGLGRDFGNSLSRNLSSAFPDFGKEKISSGSHLEKLCLVKEGVGKDQISDFTTNLIKNYILEYTQEFAKRYIDKKYCKTIQVQKVEFNYKTETWMTKPFYLPYILGDFVLLTPRDILTKDNTWINRHDIYGDFYDIVAAIPNDQLRSQINNYLSGLFPKKKKVSGKERNQILQKVIEQFPALIDYYIKFKEDNGEKAVAISESKVKETEVFFIRQLEEFVGLLLDNTEFYTTEDNSYTNAYKRVMYLKHVIEDKDGYRVFYNNNKPIKKETDLHILYKLTWFASEFEPDAEVNNGRGPVDFKISRGSRDKCLVEFKLAGNTKLKENLQHQVKIYEEANQTNNSIKVILYFDQTEYVRVQKILKELKLENDKNIVLIDASNNKKSASNVK
ncbi:MAG: hypothetical protein LWX56_00700 [Ignavibacteria bacterium]|nr:hypothetical protein [Ignavibacteria bacterium]